MCVTELECLLVVTALPTNHDSITCGIRDFCSPPRPDQLWGSPILLSSICVESSFPGVKQSWREATLSPTLVPKVNAWSYTTIFPSFALWRLITCKSGSLQIFQKSGNHLPILDARKVTLGKFLTEVPQFWSDLWTSRLSGALCSLHLDWYAVIVRERLQWLRSKY